MTYLIKRRKYRKLTPQILARIPDDELDFAIWDFIWLKVGKNHNRIDNIVSRLSAGFQMVFYTFILEGEIDNGGYNQYFFNSSGKYALLTLDSFKLIGADENHKNLKKAIAIHTREQKNVKLQKLYAERTIPSFFATYKQTKLGTCDKEFYILEGKLRQLRVRFIREHLEMFVGEISPTRKGVKSRHAAQKSKPRQPKSPVSKA